MIDAETSASFRATVEHAVRLHLKMRRLQESVRESMEVVSFLAPDAEPDDIRYAAALLREHDVPGRRVVGELMRDLKRGDAILPVGQVITRDRDDTSPWPRGEHFVYLLLAGTTVVYIGESSKPSTRVAQHRRRFSNFDRVEVISCADADAAKELEADLIFQHQPPANVMHRYGRRRP